MISTLFLQFLFLATSICQRSPSTPTAANRQIGNQQQPTQGWQYTQKGGSTKATLRSVNAIQFAYPYTQKKNVTLGIRSRSGETYLYLEATKGLFTRSFQNGSAQIQFDQQRPVSVALSAAANGRANIVFFDDAERLLNRLRKARTMSVRLRFAGQADRGIQFQPAGLRWER
ncbi:hypothetical protein [Spirosoma sp. KUDC1026]|uniref:hypothetical protein n=1 Tax=Spirosoma sp. KUDC1026 TaxID=2745947 RepID=UPI00159BBDAD|nr:hypothetical protein [Spirosoma sp. KUDC1026]QKZ14824.1 hypothetical protein HU175_20220 [Spirosoma sp. KUDC1026]